MTYQETKNRIRYLEREYSPYHVNSDELISSSYKRSINQNYKSKQDLQMIEWVLGLLNSNVKKMIKDEVYHICKNYRLKSFCGYCKLSKIIGIICLYVWRTHNKQLNLEKTILWSEYDITWREYAIVISNLLQATRSRRSV